MNYSLKNLSSVFTRQRLLAVLLVLNVVVSCLVICFSYGLYQNYNVSVREGEHQEVTFLSIFSNYNSVYTVEGGGTVTPVTKGQILSMCRSFSEELADNIEYISIGLLVSNDLFLYESEENDPDALEEDKIYLDYGIIAKHFPFAVSGGEIIPSGRPADYFTDEDFSSGRKAIYVGDECFDPDAGGSTGSLDRPARRRLLTEQDKYVTIEGEQYEIRRTGEKNDGFVYFPVTALPDDLHPFLGEYSDIAGISFKSSITASQYRELCDAVSALMGDYAYLESIQFTEAEEIYYYRTVLLISVIIAMLAAVNMAILYRYILERRSHELTILRMCGCTRRGAVLMYLAECMMLILPLFALTELLWHKLLMRRIASLFEHFENAYSLKLYLIIFAIYTAASAVVMYVMIMLTVRRHSLIEMKTGSGGSFKLFKTLEAVQLTSVLVLMTVLCSAVISRFDAYDRFSDLIQGKGYLVNYQGGFLRENEFREKLPGAEIITTDWGDYDISTGSGTERYHCIVYGSELIDRFTPLLSEGKWLNDATHSYGSDGLIPAVVAPDSPYSVGDRIVSPDNMTEWDENYEPTRTEDLCFIVVGKLKELASAISYPYIGGNPKDHRDIYGVYKSGFVDENVMFIRESDIQEIYHLDSPIRGIQFVTCSGMTDEQLKAIRRKLGNIQGAGFTDYADIEYASRKYIFEQLTTIFPIALCIFILTVISSISISAIYTKRHLRTYAIFYICGARWRSCALRSLRSGLITCGASVLLTAAVLVIGKLTFMKDTVIGFGLIPLAVCAGVLATYLALSMIMPLLIIGKTESREVLKEE